MLATSCGEDKKEVTTIDRPTATTNVIDAHEQNFKQWQEKVQKSENFASDITTFFGDKAGGVTKDNIDSIKVTTDGDPQPVEGSSENNLVTQKVKVVLTLKDNIEFKKVDDAAQSKTLNFGVTVKLMKTTA